MGMIKMNIEAVLAQSSRIAQARTDVSGVKSAVDSVNHRLEQSIRSRYNIGARLSSASAQLERIQNQLLRIQSTVESGANGYYAADMTASLKARQFPTRP